MAITSRALAFVSRWFDPATVARVFEPLIADWQREWIDAPKAERLIVHSRGMLSFFIAAMVSTPGIIRARAPKALTDQLVRRIVIATGLYTAALLVPLIREIEPAWRRGLLVLFAIPGAVTLAFPFAMVSAVDAIRRFNGIAPHVARATAAKLAALAFAVMLFNHGWVTPAANQAWRETMNPGRFAPARGLRELNTWELITGPERATAGEQRIFAFSKASVQREIGTRAALAVLPLLLVWRRWRALDLPPGRWFSPRHAALATITMIFAFGLLRVSDRFVEEAWHLPVGAGPWLTLGLIVAIGAIRVALARRTGAAA